MSFDLHVHSKYSKDSINDPKWIIKIAKKKGLSGVAITDHNTLKGSLIAKKINKDPDFEIIFGEEIKTDIGDIIALWITKEIKSRNWEEVIDEIHSQGGIAVLPHPYRGHKLIEKVAKRVDVIEVLNARTPKQLNRKAYELAVKLHKGFSAGSDAHVPFEIGRGKIFVNSDLRKALVKGNVKPDGKEFPYLLVHGISFIAEKIRITFGREY
ncbi:hypothetical protein EP1X_01245 [Thermococcus sp. EP1]|uniref:PHP domain-containing protein n=1 Tax=Thermococcus sp. EP1 TaxID=1591054 RepID=UPI0006DB5291|nr:PHP domain-containing protein [Thermococcus sp. EP1]KPU63853.1 hypothetical protein EP1X_01245 [Thermococcus sp. EP1]